MEWETRVGEEKPEDTGNEKAGGIVSGIKEEVWSTISKSRT
jgi:hypothetical protein